jgi:hypothetical protein
MPEKMARSDPLTLLGRSGMPGAIHPSHIDFRPVQKTSTIRASSGFIRGIPVQIFGTPTRADRTTPRVRKNNMGPQ